MAVEFVKGKAQEFVAVMEFALNFEDRNIPSVKIRVGDTLTYDGEVASYLKKDGDIAKGRCMGLKSAINMMGWLDLMEETDTEEYDSPEVESLFEEEEIVTPPSLPQDYGKIKGGSFDTYAEHSGEIHIQTVGNKGTEIIRENDLIVKQLTPIKKDTQVLGRGKLEVAGDQVEVKMVTSSTVTPRATPKKKFTVIEGDQYGADSAMPMKTKNASSNPKEKSAYIVDDSTPRPTEGMSREDVRRITKVINADESQDAKVVKTMSKKMDVTTVEGITLRKTDSPKDMSLKQTKSPDGFTVKTKVSSGSTSVSDASMQGAVVVGNIGGVKTGVNVAEPQDAVEVSKIGVKKEPAVVVEKTGDDLIADLFGTEDIEKKALADKRAKERAESRKKASAQTQGVMEEKKASKKQIEVEAPEVELKPEIMKKAAVVTESSSDDYLLMLPDDWGQLHWVKKEKFVKDLKDAAFVKFIQTIETTKAVLNACTERLKDLEQAG